MTKPDREPTARKPRKRCERCDRARRPRDWMTGAPQSWLRCQFLSEVVGFEHGSYGAAEVPETFGCVHWKALPRGKSVRLERWYKPIRVKPNLGSPRDDGKSRLLCNEDGCDSPATMSCIDSGLAFCGEHSRWRRGTPLKGEWQWALPTDVDDVLFVGGPER